MILVNGIEYPTTAAAVEAGVLLPVKSTRPRAMPHPFWRPVFITGTVQDEFVANPGYRGDPERKLTDILHTLGWFSAADDGDVMEYRVAFSSTDGEAVISDFRALYLSDGDCIAVGLRDEQVALLPLLTQEEQLAKEELARTRLIEEWTPASKSLIDEAEIHLPDTGLIAGPLEFPSVPGHDHCHYVMNHSFLQAGLPGIVSEIRESLETANGECAAMLKAVMVTYEATIRYIRRHAERAEKMAAGSGDSSRLLAIAANCRAISEGPPRTFVQAVQLYRFIYVMRSGPYTATIGRLDQHLYPFYRRDMDEDIISREDGVAILCELWRLFNRGITLTNVMLGGQDSEGNDCTNELSMLMMDVALTVRLPEPYINARVHRDTPQAFIDKLAEVQLMGHGQGTVYNDEVLIPGLVDFGVPLEKARNYANDGCTEVTIDSESYIEFVHMGALKSMELTLFNGEENPWVIGRRSRPMPTDMKDYDPIHDVRVQLGYRSGDVAQMTSFEEVYEAFMRQYLFQTDRAFERLASRICHLHRAGITRFTLAGTYPEFRATGQDPMRGGGFNVWCAMVFTDNIPHVADCLAAIRKIVFEERRCTMAELLDALRSDYEGHEELRQELRAAPKFGNDIDYVDDISARLVDRILEHYRNSMSPLGKPYWPALYTDRFVGFARSVGATPDGRRWGEQCAMHYTPVPGRALKGPTALLRSAAKTNLGLACGTSPVNVNLSRDHVPATPDGKKLLVSIINAARDLDIAVMTVPIYGVEDLRRAMADPDSHQDIIVRVRGFSMRFVDVDRPMQEHIVERIAG